MLDRVRSRWSGLRARRNALASLRVADKAANAVPYFVGYDVPEKIWQDHQLRREPFSGLLYMQLLSDGENEQRSTMLLSCWLSKPQFEGARALFEGRLATACDLASVEPSWTAVHGALVRPGARSWFPSISASTLVVGFAALLGALEVITHRYAALFAEPHFVVSIDGPPSGGKVLVGDELVLNIAVENNHNRTGARLFAKPALSRVTRVGGALSRDGVQLNLPLEPLAPIDVGKCGILKAAAKARSAGSYLVDVVINASAGSVRRWLYGVVPRTATVELDVWRQLSWSKLTMGAQSSTVAMLLGEVKLGRSNEVPVRCEVSMSEVGVRFNAVMGKDIHNALLPTPMAEDVRAIFEIAPSRARFRPIGYQAVLKADRHLSPASWAEVADKVRVNCE